MTPFQAWYKNNPPTINQISIFGYITYIFDKTKARFKFISKT